ncbi:hypothetical protein N658DRAFT_355311 [Parathielavia hyrcaniae]|uniref:Uncharacterized protein n=1 Tax=Parathielavia hyrcaniae TaxID=113614 RepID=A0AAN6T309_9PEZI|nr:hypothetical protein N658DRAFT_355311 [Parathielavia hyrcaniae]
MVSRRLTVSLQTGNSARPWRQRLRCAPRLRCGSRMEQFARGLSATTAVLITVPGCPPDPTFTPKSPICQKVSLCVAPEPARGKLEEKKKPATSLPVLDD